VDEIPMLLQATHDRSQLAIWPDERRIGLVVRVLQRNEGQPDGNRLQSLHHSYAPVIVHHIGGIGAQDLE
jgi:hypothetical protein